MKHKSLTERAISKRLTLLLSLSLFVLVSLYVFLFAPLYIFFANDVLYMSTVLPEVFSLLSSVTDILVFGIFYGVLLYSVYRFTLKGSKHLIAIYCIAFLYKNVGNLLMTFATDGIPTDATADLLNTAIYLLLEALQCAVAVLIGTVILSGAKKREEIRKEAAAAAGRVYTPSAESLPFTRLISLKNPLQRAAFWMAAVPMLVKVASRLIYDVWFTVMYGFYDGMIDILWMVLYYSLDIVGYGVVVYFTVILLLTHFSETEAKLRKRNATVESDVESLFG